MPGPFDFSRDTGAAAVGGNQSFLERFNEQLNEEAEGYGPSFVVWDIPGINIGGSQFGIDLSQQEISPQVFLGSVLKHPMQWFLVAVAIAGVVIALRNARR